LPHGLPFLPFSSCCVVVSKFVLCRVGWCFGEVWQLPIWGTLQCAAIMPTWH
jgi:hypothetical protein